MSETSTESVKRDEAMDLSSLLTNTTPTNEQNPNAESKTPVAKSPLDLAIENQRNSQTGIIVDSANEEEGPVKLRPNTDTEESRKGFAEEVQEQEALAEKAKMIYAIRRPEDEREYAEMIREISQVTNVDGVIRVPEGAKYIIPKTAETIVAVEAKKAEMNAGETPAETVNSTETNVEAEESNEELAKKEKKNQLVKILIDKTGLGANFKFDSEEIEAIQNSNMIHLVEVENKDLETVEIERPDDSLSFMQAVDAYKLSVSKAPMTFPASGFKADMTGLSWGEFSDITLDVSEDSDDYINFDKIYKKLSVIYNNMKNISIGKFSSFEDFLKHFAYVDVQLATYGLLISTQPEEDTITLVCNKADCKKRFNFKYSPRSIINFNSANTELLEQIDRIATVAPEDRLNLARASRVNKFLRFRLPSSGYLVDLGFASCYDYLYGILSVIKKFTDSEIPQDDSRWELTGMLQGVRGIYIPQKDGKYLSAKTPENIINVLNTAIPPEDIVVLNSAYEHYINQYYIEFSLKGVECPHCHTKTDSIAITPDELVFLIHQRQRATPITFDNFQDF